MGEDARYAHVLHVDEEDEQEAMLPMSSLSSGCEGKPVVVGKRSVITMVVVGLSVLGIVLLNSASPVDFLTISQPQPTIIKVSLSSSQCH